MLVSPFLLIILGNTLKEGFFSTKDEAESFLNEEVQRIDLFLNGAEKISIAEKAIKEARNKYIKMLHELEEEYSNSTANKREVKKLA